MCQFRMNFAVVMVAILAIVGWACVAPCSANLILNGSFEDGVDPTGIGGMVTGPGSATSDVCWWTLTSTGSEPNKFNYYADNTWNTPASFPQDGTRYMFPSSASSQRSFEQDFSVDGGSIYDVSFWMSGRPNFGSVPTLFDSRVIVDTGTLTGTMGVGGGTLTGADTDTLKLAAPTGGSQTQAVWILHSFSFTPSDSATATLRFGPNGGDVYIDNVIVELVPEPSTLALLATGLIGLLCYAWRKRK